MQEKTRQQYLSLAKSWINANFHSQGIRPSSKTIRETLEAQAQGFRPGYWRRLRRALVVYLRESGYDAAADKLQELKNPVPQSDRKPRQKRCRTVSLEDHETLLEDCHERCDRELWAALIIAQMLGARPAEMPFIKTRRLADGRLGIFIPSAKKREDETGQGDRGLDRIVYLPLDQETIALEAAVDILAGYGPMKPLQNRIQYRTEKLWPGRKVQPTMYSYRHQLGSDLKASGMNRRRVAAVMGHLNQDSASVYGNARSTSALRRHLPQPDERTVAKVLAKPPRKNPFSRQATRKQRRERSPTGVLKKAS